MPGQDRTHPFGERQHVRPGDEAEIGQTIIAGGEAEAAEEQTVELSTGQRRGKNVVDADHRHDLLPHCLPQ